MKNSTTQNIQNRYEWLIDILEGRISLSKAHQEKLVDMKAFCDLEIPSLFDKISYNTLKNYCLNKGILGSPHSIDNHWEYMRALRKKVHLAYTTGRSEAEALSKPTQKDLINEAFNQAQLASIAYLDLFKFIKKIVESDLTLNDATKQTITNFLFESSLKFEKISSYSKTSPKTWSIIQGGKGDV